MYAIEDTKDFTLCQMGLRHKLVLRGYDGKTEVVSYFNSYEKAEMVCGTLNDSSYVGLAS